MSILTNPPTTTITPLPTGDVLVVVKRYDGLTWHDVTEMQLQGKQAVDVMTLLAAVAQVCASTRTRPQLREAIGHIYDVMGVVPHG